MWANETPISHRTQNDVLNRQLDPDTRIWGPGI